MSGYEELFKCRRFLFQNEVALCLRELDLAEVCETLISVEGMEAVFNDPSKSTIRALMGLAILPLVVSDSILSLQFSKLLSQILNDDRSTEREEFLDLVWEHIEKLKIQLGISIVEELAEKYPKYIEIKVLDIFSKTLCNSSLTNDDVNAMWNNERLLLKLCTESSLIFSLVSSIMNEILINVRFKATTNCLQVIRSFVSNVSMMCSRIGGITELYPENCRYLISLLDILKEDSLYKFDGCVQDKYKNIAGIIEKALKDRPESVITLISHQPPIPINNESPI